MTSRAKPTFKVAKSIVQMRTITLFGIDEVRAKDRTSRGLNWRPGKNRHRQEFQNFRGSDLAISSRHHEKAECGGSKIGLTKPMQVGKLVLSKL
jgi:hypothetical protein